jgi:branched-chain amino acid transport system substrate-binding protein
MLRDVCLNLVFFAIFQANCSKPEPILIGFSGQLSGAYADLGIKGRDGVLLAVEKIDEAGGIAGRPMKL